MSVKPLVKKVAVVTGASSGIGFAAACALARDGALVAIIYCGNEAGADKCLAEVRAQGSDGIRIRADLAEPAQGRQAIEQARRALGPVDILVNNAGSLVKRLKLLDLDERTWDQAMNLNLKSVFVLSQAAARDMMDRRSGAIVNVASIAAHHGGGIGAMHYAVAKAGVVALTKGLAKELAAYNVRANAVAPGTVDTAYHSNFSDSATVAAYLNTVPLKRMATPSEVAEAIVFLASDRASYITGETLEINGGVLMV